MIHGMDITLINFTENGVDALNRPIIERTETTVSDVLVGEPNSNEVISGTELHGKEIAYVLGIPKGDTHNWNNCEVEFFGERFKSYGHPIIGIEANVPTRWHKKVMVVRYE